MIKHFREKELVDLLTVCSMSKFSGLFLGTGVEMRYLFHLFFGEISDRVRVKRFFLVYIVKRRHTALS